MFELVNKLDNCLKKLIHNFEFMKRSVRFPIKFFNKVVY